jgi:hypothetical protein
MWFRITFSDILSKTLQLVIAPDLCRDVRVSLGWRLSISYGIRAHLRVHLKKIVVPILFWFYSRRMHKKKSE